MRQIELEKKGKYEEMVEYIYNNYDIDEETNFNFTRIVETNAKMRRRKEFKNVYSYEVECTIHLNNNEHKKNLFKKVCMPERTYKPDFDRLGID